MGFGREEVHRWLLPVRYTKPIMVRTLNKTNHFVESSCVAKKWTIQEVVRWMGRSGAGRMKGKKGGRKKEIRGRERERGMTGRTPRDKKDDVKREKIRENLEV